MVSCSELLTGSCRALLALSFLLRLAHGTVFSGDVILLLVSVPKPQCTENKSLQLHAVRSWRFPNSRSSIVDVFSALPVWRGKLSTGVLLERFRRRIYLLSGKDYSRRNICNLLGACSQGLTNQIVKYPENTSTLKNAFKVKLKDK